MKHLFCVFAFLLMTFSLNAQRVFHTSFEELTDTLSSRYDITLNVQSLAFDHDVIAFSSEPNWTNTNPKKGYFLCGISYMILNKAGDVAILLSPESAYSEERLTRSLRCGSAIYNMQISLLTLSNNDQKLEKEVQIIAETDSLIRYSVPEGVSVFSHSWGPGLLKDLDLGYDDEANPTLLQQLYTERYPFLDRYYYIKKGRPPYAFIVLSKNGYEADSEKIMDMIANVFSIEHN